MLIDIINQDAENRLLYFVGQGNKQNMPWGVLYFYRSRLAHLPSEDDLLLTVRPALEDKLAAIYFFTSGDAAVIWNGTQKATLENLSGRLCERYAPKSDEKLLHYYDLQAGGEELRLLLQQKLKIIPNNAPPEKATPVETSCKLSFTDEQIERIQHYGGERQTVKSPTVLIVEDQVFSRKLLEGMLGKSNACYCAVNAQQAVALYAEHIPCIAFLDIELPDVNGHDLAAFIKQYDPDSFIVMVTANNYEKDVAMARKNQVQGFIAKPYSKQKITEAIQKFQNERIFKPHNERALKL